MSTIMPRRRFLTGIVGLIAAPAVVRFESLMPVKALPAETPLEELLFLDLPPSITLKELARANAIAVDYYRDLWRELGTGKVMTAHEMLLHRDELAARFRT